MKAAKVLLSLLLAISALFTLNHSSASASSSFKDVSSDFRAYKEITYLAQGKIVLGSNGYYYPSRPVTRAEAAAMIGRALGFSGTKSNTVFKDVDSSNFASGYIMAAYEKGIISGYTDKTFRPSANVTRAEMALLITRAFGYATDGSTDSAILALKSRGIAQGFANGDFGGSQSITRADYAVFLARAINYSLRLESILSLTDEYLYVSSAGLNVRSGPSINYPSVGTLKLGAKVQVAYRVGPWTMIKSGSTIGFVNSSHLTSTPVSDPLSDLTLVIDPGHGGKDPGAVALGAQEKDVVLKTGVYLQQYLANTPINVEMTRSTDVFIELEDRVAYAEEVNGSAFVSIHANAYNGNASGSETYYYRAAAVNPHTEDSKLLATYIQKRVVAAMGTKDRGVKEANYYVTKYNSMPAALVELGFIDNEADNAKLISTTYQQKAAKAIYHGILDYFGAKGYNVSSYY